MSLAVALGSVAALALLPYSTSWITRVNEDEVLARPGPSFSMGSLRWDLAQYRAAASLEAFRAVFLAPCGELRGLDAARCVTDIIQARSTNGAPTREFVDANFDPADALRTHLSGEQAGHCTARSSMLATALLAMGAPARVVQVHPLEGPGHNLTEVWDEQRGWLIFDPHFDSSYLLGDDFLSSVKLSQIAGGLRWRRPHAGAPDPNAFAGSTITFPEPWLYTRVGERCATWPFRGCFAQVGPVQLTHGPAQKAALFGAFGFAGLSSFLAVMAIRLRSRAGRP